MVPQAAVLHRGSSPAAAAGPAPLREPAVLSLNGCTPPKASLLVAPPGLTAALALLLKSYDYARELKKPLWEFAVEIPELRDAGLTNADLRWLVCSGYAQHARETTSRRGRSRSFQLTTNLGFGARTCFVLTETGAAFAAALGCHSQQLQGRNGKHAPGSEPGARVALLPEWDSQCRELRYAGQLVKRFKQPAPNQELILTVFQEEGWPSHIDDPLPPHPEKDPKQRIHDAINHLNRSQTCRAIRFRGDSSGRGVCWEPLL